MKTSWNLELLYKSPRDPKIEKDIRSAENALAAFEKKYRAKADYTKSESALLTALQDYETLSKKIASGKPGMYFAFVKELDSTNNDAEAMIRKIDERMTKAGNRIQFFELALGKIPAEKQKAYLKSKRLEPYRRFLEHLFETAKHDLSEPEEKLMALKSGPSWSMWVSGVDAMLNKQKITFKKKQIPINEAIELVTKQKTVSDRRALWSTITERLKSISDFPESEINAIFTDKKISDELRGFKEPYDRTILGYENNRESVLALVDAVTKAFPISHRFYKLKKKLLKLPKLTYADRGASIGMTTKKYAFPESVALVREAFEVADPQYARILDDYLREGQIDVYPKPNKGGGAFCASSYGLPTFVMLNHVDELRSLSTLAHEMGHAIHSERCRTQPVFYQGHSTAVAETASTFFESLGFERAVSELSEKERIIALHDRIQDDVSTIFRQIAFFNFELDLHTRVRSDGWVPKEEIAKLMNKHLAAYLGSSVELSEEDGYSFVYIGHFRRPFYVYSYAYGQLISKALLERSKADPAYFKKVDQFLSAGRSKTPEQIFADIGIEVGPKLFADGLRSIERDIAELERLAR